MTITFFSNYMNHHQEFISNQLYKMLSGHYHFVACESINVERLQLGYCDMNKKYDYVVRPYEDIKQEEYAKKLALNSDIVIIGSADIKYLKLRMSVNKTTFLYSERLFKKGFCEKFNPILRWHVFEKFIQYKSKKLYVLCSSAYTSQDLLLCGFPAQKCYKWGYFPQTKKHDIRVLLSKKVLNEILWVGRFIEWKHPETAVDLAEKLKNKGMSFHLTMVGNGIEMTRIKKVIDKRNLKDVITLTGSMSPDKVRKYMEKSPIFLSTSNFQEGWGAVLNEAMNSGCACVASHAVGAAPYLINNGQNGLIYKNGSIKDLVDKISLLLSDSKFCECIGYKAYKTTQENWNENIAAKRLVELSDSLNGNGEVSFIDGICSKAEILKNNWY